MNEPKAPSIPSHDEQFQKDGNQGLDGWVPSTNPHEGRLYDDGDSECAGDCPTCD